MMSTIFALSSGAPPAAIGVIRVSGPAAAAALSTLVGRLPAPRRASMAVLRDQSGTVLDHALVLWFPGPGSATGEDCAELQLHGGRAVVAAVEAALLECPGLRRAEPGEFTRRAFVNGRIDLSEAEGLADLLTAETELQRRAAVEMAGGAFSRVVGQWRERVLLLSAEVEAALDFADDDDVTEPCSTWNIDSLRRELDDWLAQPRAEALREGFRVVLAGPPNAGKSTLFNALVESEAAITSPIAGTTRDIVSRSVSIAGVPFQFLDTAGLHDGSGDVIEQIGMERARKALDGADLILWLGDLAECPEGAWDIAAQADRGDRPDKPNPRHRVSAVSGLGLDALRADLVASARAALPRPGALALNARQSRLITQARDALAEATVQSDPILVAEGLRVARLAFDGLTGRVTTEDMLDTLFGRFCIGK